MEKQKLTPEQIKEVKALGFLINRGTTRFSARVITENGVLTASQMQAISEAAQKYGNGNITFTVRLTVEIQGIEYDNIEPFRDYIKKAGLQTGGTGAKVRPVVACKGTTCTFGLCDTHGMAKEIHTRFFEGYRDVTLPHKFKIAVGGCPNNCAKPNLNDIGIVGQRKPNYDFSACHSCGKCGLEIACPMGAAKKGEDGKLAINEDICNHCGRCLNKCPFKLAVEAEDCLKIYIGGRWGKKIRIGTQLSRLFARQEALDMVEKLILLFKAYGKQGERFGETIDRMGIDAVEGIIFTDVLLENKSAIINGSYEVQG